LKGYKRRRVLIDGLQVRLMAFNLGYLSAYSLIVTGLLLAPLVLELEALGGPTTEKQQAAVQLLYLHARILPAFVVALCVFAVHGLFFSHRIVGPLFRFKQVFRSVAAGEVPRGVHLREKDYLRPEARELGKMLTSLRSRLGDIHAERACVERGWSHLERAMRTGNGDDIDYRLNDLKDRIEALSVEISRFDIGAAETDRGEWSRSDVSVDQIPPVRKQAPEPTVKKT
jgi:hypothetical protein